MPRRTIGERMEFAKQRKEKAAQDEAALARMLRAQRDRRIYQLGGLVAKAGLQLSSAALYGGLLRMAADAGDAATVARWEEAGGQEFHREQVTRVVAVAKFPREIPRELSAQIRGLGLRWNALREEWEGRVEWETAKALVEGKGGKITKVKN
jgi:hypothetical protein